MKLARITKPLRSVQVRVILAGDLNVGLDRYDEHVQGETVGTRALLPEIIRTFLDTDREFQLWSRSCASDQARRISAPSSSNGSTEAPA